MRENGIPLITLTRPQTTKASIHHRKTYRVERGPLCKWRASSITDLFHLERKGEPSWFHHSIVRMEVKQLAECNQWKQWVCRKPFWVRSKRQVSFPYQVSSPSSLFFSPSSTLQPLSSARMACHGRIKSGMNKKEQATHTNTIEQVYPHMITACMHRCMDVGPASLRP